MLDRLSDSLFGPMALLLIASSVLGGGWLVCFLKRHLDFARTFKAQERRVR